VSKDFKNSAGVVSIRMPASFEQLVGFLLQACWESTWDAETALTGFMEW